MLRELINSSRTLSLFTLSCQSYPIHGIHKCALPFDDSMCITGPDTGFQMDSGFFDSHHILGIPPTANRGYIRKQATCSVLQNSPNYLEERISQTRTALLPELTDFILGRTRTTIHTNAKPLPGAMRSDTIFCKFSPLHFGDISTQAH